MRKRKPVQTTLALPLIECVCVATPKPQGMRVRCRVCGTEYGRNEHRCHAEGCDKVVQPRMLFCPRHWAMTPRDIQRAVWREYVPGQEVRKDPTREYLDVMRQAIEAVARIEGRRQTT